MPVTPTQLRKNLYKILDQVISTQKPVQIIRGEHVVKLIVDTPKLSKKLDKLQPHPNILNVKPDSIVHMDWSEFWTDGIDM